MQRVGGNLYTVVAGSGQPEKPEFADFRDAIADWTVKVPLRPQQRLTRAAIADQAICVVSEGIVAIDVSSSNLPRQVLDFLVAGDVLPLRSLQCSATVSLRAVSKAELISPDGARLPHGSHLSDDWQLFYPRIEAQLARSHLHQIIIGSLEAEQRVAAFLMVLAMRCGGSWQANRLLPLPMSRDDIAGHLAINSDTLSRIMMRFETQHMIERVNRHAIRVLSFDKLKPIARIAALIQETIERPAVCQLQKRDASMIPASVAYQQTRSAMT
jgi:CRP/FNR family transcriptional regulator, anaerobic regulatory protein